MSDGIGSGTPGRLTPLCERTSPPTMTAQRARPRSTVSTREAHVAVVDQDVVAGPQHRAEDGRARPAGRRPGRRPRRRSRPCRRRASSTSAVELADAELRPLQVGDERDRPAGVLLGLADELARVRAWSSCVPCDMLSRAPSMPASISAAIISGRRRGRPDGGDDLRAAGVTGHAVTVDRRQRSPRGERRPAGVRGLRRRAPPRSAAAGCTSRRDRSGPARRS